MAVKEDYSKSEDAYGFEDDEGDSYVLSGDGDDIHLCWVNCNQNIDMGYEGARAIAKKILEIVGE